MKPPRWWSRRWVPYKVHRDLAVHHRDCERAGEQMYAAIEKMRRRTGAGDPVSKPDIIALDEANAVWAEHQWPAL